MGIPGFSTWLRARYPDAFEDPKAHGRAHDAVYIDLASTLHTVTRKAYSKSAFHVLLHRRLDELIDSLGPTKRVVIAMDGPAPLAKLLEQRRRRKKEADKTMSDGSDDEGDDSETGGISRKKSHSYKVQGRQKGVSSLFLTTGTLFMLEVHNSLLCYIIRRLQVRYCCLLFVSAADAAAAACMVA
jgi:5'-3' exonuclease